VKIPTGTAKQQLADAAQDRVAEIAVQRRHGARLDATTKAIAHHQLTAGA
jgi:hypothetical protein